MADTALSALTATTTLASGDLIYVVDGGNSRKIDWDDVVAQLAAATKTLTNTTIDANGTGNSVTNIETADLAAGAKSGADATLVTGTAGTDGNLVAWNADGDAVDSGSAVSDFATAAQGALADSAVQPGDDADTLGSGDATDGWVLTADGAGGAAWEAAAGGGGGTPAGSSGQFQYNDGGVFAAADLWQATNEIEQRNSTNAQTFNIYNTYTDASNYERGFMKWSGNELEIGTQSLGTGAARSVGIYSNNVRYQIIGSNFNQFDKPLYMNGADIVTGGAGFKIGTATTQKIGFWNATPVVQPTTGISAGAFVANTSGISDDTATFDGYTVGQVVAALRQIGVLA